MQVQDDANYILMRSFCFDNLTKHAAGPFLYRDTYVYGTAFETLWIFGHMSMDFFSYFEAKRGMSNTGFLKNLDFLMEINFGLFN